MLKSNLDRSRPPSVAADQINRAIRFCFRFSFPKEIRPAFYLPDV